MADGVTLERSSVGIWKNRLGAVTIACLLLVGAASAKAEELTTDVRDALERGVAAARGQQWLVALQQFDIAFDKAPTAPEVLFNLALANDRMGGREIRAIGWYRAYLAAAPRAANRDQIVARIAGLEVAARTTAQGLINKALAANKLLPTESDRTGGLSDIGRAQAKLGDVAGAFATMANLPSGNMGTYYLDNGYGSLAAEFARAGDFANAENAIRKVVAADPRDSAIDSVVGVLLTANKIADALAYAANIKGVQRIRTYLQLAQAQAKAKDQAGARQSLDRAVSARNDLPEKERTASRAGSLIETAVSINELSVAKREFDSALRAWNSVPKAKRSLEGPENLIKAATRLNDLESARRLYADIDWKSEALKYGNKPHVIYLMAQAYIAAGHFTEARALLPKITDKFWHGYADRELDSASRDLVAKRGATIRALIEAGKFTEAEAALAHEPKTFEFAVIRSVLADAYQKVGNLAAARRILGATAASVAQEPQPGVAAEARIALADSYRLVGDFAAARRTLDLTATPVILSAMQTQSYRSSSFIGSIVRQYTRLAIAELDVKNLPAAKSAAAAALKAAGFIKEASARASELELLADAAAKLGLDLEINTIGASLPAGTGRDQLFAKLAIGYGSAGAADKAATAAGQIADSSKRKEALIAIIRGRTAMGDWKGALALANNSTLPSALNAVIAADMLSAGLASDAIAIEPKIAASALDLDTYLSALALHFANSGDFDRAVAMALRQSTLVGRLSGLRSIVFVADSLAGQAQEKSIFDQMQKIYAGASTAERASLCSTPYVISVNADTGAAYRALLNECQTNALASARALKAGEARSKAMANALQPLAKRKYIGSMLVNAATMSSSYDQSSAIRSALNILIKDSAAEKYTQLSRDMSEFSDKDYMSTMLNALVEAGNNSAADDLMHRRYDQLEADPAQSSKDSEFSTMASKLVAMDQFDTAAAIIARIKSASSQFSPLYELATAMVRVGRKAEALVYIKQSADKARDAGYPFYFSGIARLATEAGDYAFATALQAKAPENYQVSGQAGLTAGLLKSGQLDKVSGAIAADEAILLKQKTTSHWDAAVTFAANIGWSGDEARLEQLVVRAPQPRFAAAILMSAANGYAKAGKADKARQVLARALKLLHIDRPDFLAWSNYRIALAEAEINPDAAQKRVLAIDDAHWRIRAAVELASAQFQRKEGKQAVELLRALPPSAPLNGSLFSAVTYLVSHGAAADARAFAAKISDGALRDRARRFLVLIQARRGETEAAFADVSFIDDAAERAYVYIDLAALLADRNQRPQALLANLAAAKLAETLSDPLVKSDIMANIAQNQTGLDRDAADAMRSKAVAAAKSITDDQDREVAMGWAEGPNFKKAQADQQRASKLVSDFGDKWRYFLKNTLSGDMYSGMDSYVHSLSTKDPRQIVASLAQTAGDIGVRILELKVMSADWLKRHESAGN